jgi:hypothetical protein
MAEPKRRVGRPSVGERVPLGLRVTPEMKARLDAAAELAGRSQSQEAEFRLERSFDRGDLLPDVLSLAYGRQMAGILMMLGVTMDDVADLHVNTRRRHWRRSDLHWTEDPAAFELARLVAITLLSALRPAGDTRRLIRRRDAEKAVEILNELLRAVRLGSKARDDPFFTAPPSPPWCDANIIRALLGPIAKRITEAKLTQARQQLFHSLPDESARPGMDSLPIEKIAVAANAILKVINSSPHTPSQQELVGILQRALLPQNKGTTHEEPKT